jgi:ribosomal protein S18 acetylase RimI-like enzyme
MIMTVTIRPLVEVDIEAILDLSIAAWEPVFASFRQVLGATIYTHIYPDWQKQQREGVEGVLRDAKFTVYVADVDGVVAGFIAYFFQAGEQAGEVEMLAVHPDYQQRGIATELNTFVLRAMKAQGYKLAVVATGGDPGHAPARKAYEKAGYTALPLVRYYQAL